MEKKAKRLVLIGQSNHAYPGDEPYRYRNRRGSVVARRFRAASRGQIKGLSFDQTRVNKRKLGQIGNSLNSL